VLHTYREMLLMMAAAVGAAASVVARMQKKSGGVGVRAIQIGGGEGRATWGVMRLDDSTMSQQI
jgi:hypothetical protein